jgi:DNA polymerase-4
VRKIIHIDMDAFYASIEQRNNPDLRGKPVIVSGPPNSRSVVSTCSYEARKFGIHSAMPASQAYRLCPHGIFVPPHFSEYKEASEEIHAIFKQFTDKLEPLSLDEAYLDVTENKENYRSSTLIAREIKNRINNKTRLTASAGISYNKFLAKIASDWKKPNGITIITPKQAISFLEELPIRKFYGIGKKTEETMEKLGIKTGFDLKKFERWELLDMFGKSGSYYYDVVRGIDHREVQSHRIRKSIGKEETFGNDIFKREDIIDSLNIISQNLYDSLVKYKEKGKTVTLKIKYHDFEQVTRSISLEQPVFEKEEIMKWAVKLLEKTEAGNRPIRLAGITISHLLGNNNGIDDQLALF